MGHLVEEPACTGAAIGVLAKIESADSVGNLEDILDAVDGAMVARGDLGAELPVEEVRSHGPLLHAVLSRSEGVATATLGVAVCGTEGPMKFLVPARTEASPEF